MHKTDTAKIVISLRVFSGAIASTERVLSGILAEAADRMEEMQKRLDILEGRYGEGKREITKPTSRPPLSHFYP